MGSAAERPGLADDASGFERSELASGRPGLASERPWLASDKLGLISEGPWLASDVS